MSHTAVIINTAVAIIAVVVMIVRFKFNPVVSLVVGSAYLGLAVGLGVDKTIDAIMTAMNVLGHDTAMKSELTDYGARPGLVVQEVMR